jgi:flagellar FliL protein
MAGTTPPSAGTSAPTQTRRTLPTPKREKTMAAATIAAPPGAEVTTGGGKKKKLIVILLVVAIAAGAGWWFFLKPSGPKQPEKPKPGVIVTLEPVTINLASGHYLKVGLSLQQSAKAKEEADGAKALDLAIELFSGRSINDLADREKRESLKKGLIKEIAEAYEDEVYTLYFNEFVWQ